MDTRQMHKAVAQGELDGAFAYLYGRRAPEQPQRYLQVLEGFESLFGAGRQVRLFSAPLKLALKVLCNTLLGLGALLLLNAAAPFTGLSLGLNLFNAAVVGVLGIPGLGLLLLVQWIFT